MIAKQHGVGMIEVLVALVILAIGVLGFSALQLRAMEATAEASDRTMAMNLARDLAERIRINRLGLNDYIKSINEEKPVVKDCMGKEKTYVPNCGKTKIAQYDSTEVVEKAAEKGQEVAMELCQGSTLTCIYVAWGKTTIKERDSATGIPSKLTIENCVTSGSYVSGSQCLMMEAF